ncbi:hypothetical protein EVAR_55344_1 [Eumeta japonica]|uniref:Uncharacterized protein n=1 Tax=Eumeta variegata TaxID=151549 RepID=A0A4C1YFC6_EUMVA|nr:hypothetical protein EVAR_55344_1 [Eumeta japonica]
MTVLFVVENRVFTVTALDVCICTFRCVNLDCRLEGMEGRETISAAFGMIISENIQVARKLLTKLMVFLKEPLPSAAERRTSARGPLQAMRWGRQMTGKIRSRPDNFVKRAERERNLTRRVAVKSTTSSNIMTGRYRRAAGM